MNQFIEGMLTYPFLQKYTYRELPLPTQVGQFSLVLIVSQLYRHVLRYRPVDHQQLAVYGIPNDGVTMSWHIEVDVHVLLLIA